MNLYPLYVGETGKKIFVQFLDRDGGVSDATTITLRYKKDGTTYERTMTMVTASTDTAYYQWTSADFLILDKQMNLPLDFKLTFTDGVIYWPSPDIGPDLLQVKLPI